MPGTQPEAVTLEDPSQCLNCHGGYDASTEPGAWQGSMMGQAARDPIFWAATTVAAQDSIWAIGNPNAADLCLRCHFPQGWLEGRSDPTNASLMQGPDYDGVHCGHCHRMVDPFFETTYSGVREGSDWLDYWDETNLSDTASNDAALSSYLLDETALAGIELFNGNAFFTPENLPHSTTYTENAGGQYFIDPSVIRRGPFADANASHDLDYSRYHKSRYFCSTCHDVSNPVLENIAHGDAQPGDETTILPSENFSAYQYGHVERTFSEFMLSDFGLQGGAPGSGAYAPGVFSTSLENNYIARCQDCHMPDRTGKASSQSKAVLRPDESTEHPKSGVPSHDMTGGNFWVPWVLASTVPSSPNHDELNQSILDQGASVLTLDLDAGIGLNPAKLLDAADRALSNLQIAATIDDAEYDLFSNLLSFKVVNHTGHKLLSGFPEGRRMWVNVQIFGPGETLIGEINPYDHDAATLKGLSASYDDPDQVLPDPSELTSSEWHSETLIYEMIPSSSLTGEEHTFHFVLADGRYKDNRIPPKGFRIDDAAERLSEPAWEGSTVTEYFSAEEYLGGFDEIELESIREAVKVQLRLFYQTTSREYIEFLRDEINGTASTLEGNGAGGDPPYLIQSDPFFDQLKAWGDVIWQLWSHNRSIPGASPILMAESVIELEGCEPLVLDNDVISSSESYVGCPSVAVGPDWTITQSGEVSILAEEWISFDAGLSIELGASLRAEVDD